MRARLTDDRAWVPIAARVGRCRRPTSASRCASSSRTAARSTRCRSTTTGRATGFSALEACLRRVTPETVIERDRAPRACAAAAARGSRPRSSGTSRAARPATQKYVICNGDEGDPGAFMDRMVLESYPFRVHRGPDHRRLCGRRARGHLLHPRASTRSRCGTCARRSRRPRRPGCWANDPRPPFSFTLQVREGAGAFVCGEETALIQSIEGERGMPRLRPPFPAQSGLWGQPTLINNVETLACVPWIIRTGADGVRRAGDGSVSKGTKVFALAGKIAARRPDRSADGHHDPRDRRGDRRRRSRTGGRSRPCRSAGRRAAASRRSWPTRRSTTRRWPSTGAIMGSGGLVVLDDRDCMVDIARYFLQFTQDESCGKCTFCRVGTQADARDPGADLRRARGGRATSRRSRNWPSA